MGSIGDLGYLERDEGIIEDIGKMGEGSGKHRWFLGIGEGIVDDLGILGEERGNHRRSGEMRRVEGSI